MNRVRNVRRRFMNSLALAVVYTLTAIALIPLALVLWYTAVKGWPAASHLEFYVNVERPVGIPGAGVAHAIVGSAVMVGLASLISIPVGVISGVNLVEFGGRFARVVRLAADVLVGAPSIAIGLFAYVLFVAPFHHFSGVAGALALAVLMLPVVIRTTEGAVALIPASLRESGLALGLPRWRVALQLVLPAAAPGVITGALLAIARAAGETAPLLFTGFGNRFWNVDPTQPMSALPLIVFHDALTPYPALQEQAWGAALVLVAAMLVVNLASRWAVRRQVRLAGQL
ncbi:MAG: phosphate ABC transporter permease PstA [Chloroflexi bacterium]|nr:MAG: phosphate ABC transporter permease PstA [Chloroflexota bacterium]TMF38091.1 MAG: phosphate ABC transporter permease PstA [Chloroflexota bacterium]